MTSAGGHHVPGTAYHWEHGYHPLDEETAVKYRHKWTGGKQNARPITTRKDSLDAWSPAELHHLEHIAEEHPDADRERHDAVLEAIAHAQGFDGRPSTGRLDPDRDILSRGFGANDSAHDFVDQFLHGAYWAGTGIHGNGMYTTTRHERAETYGADALLRMQLSPDARTTHVNDMWDRIDNLQPELRRIVGGDPGRMAAMLGFDAMKARGSTVIVLNRRAVTVDTSTAMDHAIRTAAGRRERR